MWWVSQDIYDNRENSFRFLVLPQDPAYLEFGITKSFKPEAIDVAIYLPHNRAAGNIRLLWITIPVYAQSQFNCTISEWGVNECLQERPPFRRARIQEPVAYNHVYPSVFVEMNARFRKRVESLSCHGNVSAALRSHRVCLLRYVNGKVPERAIARGLKVESGTPTFARIDGYDPTCLPSRPCFEVPRLRKLYWPVLRTHPQIHADTIHSELKSVSAHQPEYSRIFNRLQSRAKSRIINIMFRICINRLKIINNRTGKNRAKMVLVFMASEDTELLHLCYSLLVECNTLAIEIVRGNRFPGMISTSVAWTEIRSERFNCMLGFIPTCIQYSVFLARLFRPPRAYRRIRQIAATRRPAVLLLRAGSGTFPINLSTRISRALLRAILRQ